MKKPSVASIAKELQALGYIAHESPFIWAAAASAKVKVYQIVHHSNMLELYLHYKNARWNLKYSLATGFCFREVIRSKETTTVIRERLMWTICEVQDLPSVLLLYGNV